MKSVIHYCSLETTEEETEEAAAGLATAQEISMAAAVTAVLTELDNICTLKDFLEGKYFFFFFFYKTPD